MARKRKKQSETASGPEGPARRCGLCGKTKNLTQTECCGNWICNDEHKYVVFSYARNSCHRNHNRFTLCAFHFNEGHEGHWKDCPKCREGFGTEMYVWYGTNEYNFEKLENPPSYEPTCCAQCNRVIRLGGDGFSFKGGRYYCADCTTEELRDLVDPSKKRRQK